MLKIIISVLRLFYIIFVLDLLVSLGQEKKISNCNYYRNKCYKIFK